MAVHPGLGILVGFVACTSEPTSHCIHVFRNGGVRGNLNDVLKDWQMRLRKHAAHHSSIGEAKGTYR